MIPSENTIDNLDAVNLRLKRQNDVLIALAKVHVHSVRDLSAAIQSVNEAAADTLGSDRASVWFYEADRSSIKCFDLFERGPRAHTHGMTVRLSDYPRFFDVLSEERSLAIESCKHDERVAEFYSGYLARLHIQSLLTSAVWVDGQVVGIVTHGQVRVERRWTLDERNFLVSLANTVAHWVDMAGRREAEDSLQAMRFAIDRASDAVLWVGPEGNIHYANGAACKLLGCEHAELVSSPLFRFVPRLGPEGWPAKWAHVKERGVLTFESRHVLQGGKLVNVEISLNYFEYQQREYQCAIVRDVTERKAAQLELEKQRSFFRKVIDMNPNFIFAKDRDGRFILVNQAVAEAYGSTVERIVGRCDADFNSNAEEVEHFRKDDLEVMDECREKFVAEERITDAQGRVRYLQTVKRPIIEDDGAVNKILGVATDITDRKRAEEEQTRLLAQMQYAQKLESLGVLAGGIAHDFNNLLMGVIGNATLALTELEAGSQPYRRVQQVTLAAKRAAELTNQLLAYSGRGKFVIEPTDLSKLVDEMGTLLETIISKKARVSYERGEGVPCIDADSSQMRQVVMNLITNASDALGDRGGMIIVRTGIESISEDTVSDLYFDDSLACGDYAFLEVTDNGCGMDEETVQKIFDPFFTTKFTGRGLGLAAVQGIVRSHHGALRVKSSPGRGTSFRILFPAGKTMPEAPQEGFHPNRLKENRGGLFLVVDDEDVSRHVTREMLEHFGYRVVLAQHGLEALEVFKQHSSKIAAVILDMTMPQMDGEETWTELSQLQFDVPVILTSGYSEVEVASRFEGKKIAGFIQKPFHLEQLKAKIDELLM